MTKPTSNSNVDHTDHHVTENDKSKSSQAKQTADKYQQLRPTNQHYLSQNSNFVSTPLLLSSSVRDTNIGRGVYSNSSVAVSQKNESQVEKLRKTQNQVLQSLKKTCNIRTTEELAASSVELQPGDFTIFLCYFTFCVISRSYFILFWY